MFGGINFFERSKPEFLFRIYIKKIVFVSDTNFQRNIFTVTIYLLAVIGILVKTNGRIENGGMNNMVKGNKLQNQN